MSPLLFRRIEHFLARLGDLGEVLHPFVRTARVDDGARVEALLARVDDRIERAAPAAPDDLDVLHGVRAARHRPHDVVVVAGVDIFVHHDHVAAEIGARVALRGDERGLARVARIALLDRDDEHETAAAGDRKPYALDVRHAGLFQLVPDKRRAEIRAIPAQFRRRTAWRRAQNNRVVAVIDALDLDDRLGTLVARVIAGPLAEWTFGPRLVENNVAFDRDLGSRRNREAGVLAFEDFERLAAHAADELVFRHAVGNFDAAGEKRERVMAERHRDLAVPAGVQIFLALDAPVLAGRDVEADRVLVVDHDAVGAVIHPTLVGVFGDVDAAGADVASAVVLVPFRRWEFEDVDVAVALNVFHARRVFDELGGHRLDLFVALAPIAHEVHLALARRNVQRHRQALARAERVRQHTVALRVAFDVVEEPRRTVLDMVHELGNGADFEVPVAPSERPDLALPGRFDPVPEVAILHEFLRYVDEKVFILRTTNCIEILPKRQGDERITQRYRLQTILRRVTHEACPARSSRATRSKPPPHERRPKGRKSF